MEYGATLSAFWPLRRQTHQELWECDTVGRVVVLGTYLVLVDTVSPLHLMNTAADEDRGPLLCSRPAQCSAERTHITMIIQRS